MLQQGCDLADELACPTYLEGSAKGVPAYEKVGFESLEVVPVSDDHVCTVMLRQPRAETSAL